MKSSSMQSSFPVSVRRKPQLSNTCSPLNHNSATRPPAVNTHQAWGQAASIMSATKPVCTATWKSMPPQTDLSGLKIPGCVRRPRPTHCVYLKEEKHKQDKQQILSAIPSLQACSGGEKRDSASTGCERTCCKKQGTSTVIFTKSRTLTVRCLKWALS